MTSNTCNIIAGGDPFSRELYDRWAYKDGLVICADRGYEYAQSLGIEPDLIMGDFDSASRRPEGSKVLTFPVEKDDTDTMLAAKEGLARGCTRFMIFGATGGRIDHLIGNIQTLALLLENGATGAIAAENDHIRLLSPGEYVFPKVPGFSLSFFAYTKTVEGFTVSGTKYCAQDQVITDHSTYSMSNMITEDRARLSFAKGILLMVESRL